MNQGQITREAMRVTTIAVLLATAACFHEGSGLQIAAEGGQDDGGSSSSAAEEATTGDGHSSSTVAGASAGEASAGTSSDDGSSDDDGDGASSEDGSSTSDAPSGCGDAAVDVGEACDDGVNDSSYGGCAPGCQLAPFCGDGVLQDEHELCDGAPLGAFGCTATCVPDFSAVPQLYCAGLCSYAGPQGCDQADADTFCRLRTGDDASTATSYQVGIAMAQPGFSCVGYGVELGPMPLLGVPGSVWYVDASLVELVGPGDTILGVVCS